mmetsp:Transcript_39031/g.96445  ORF Transcript_39031/g.96445 Transcript_39031/m.96445 type:complete len:560 (+) Transcript_39031:145-1824(+)
MHGSDAAASNRIDLELDPPSEHAAFVKPDAAAAAAAQRRRMLLGLAAVITVLIVGGVLLFVFVQRGARPAPVPVTTSAAPSNTSSADSADSSSGGSSGGSSDAAQKPFITFPGGFSPTIGNIGNIPGLSQLLPTGTQPSSIAQGFSSLAGFINSGLPSDWQQSLSSLAGVSIPTVWAPLKSTAYNGSILLGSIHNEGRVWDTADATELAAYESLLVDNFDVITPENGCKTGPIFGAGPNAPDWSKCDRVIDWARGKGLKVRMHVLAWGDWNPAWINDLQLGEKRAALLGLMRQVMERYKNQKHVIYWDIVNEAVCDNVFMTKAKKNCPSDGGLLKGGDGTSSWYPDIPDYIDAAFALARQILPPDRILVYNDYGFESTHDRVDSDKNQRVYDYVKEAIEVRNVPIDAIGFQFHIANIYAANGVLGSTLFGSYMDGVKEQFDKFAALGIKVHVTEIDVGCSFPTLPCLFPSSFAPASRQIAQADVYSGVLQHCLDTDACTVYQLWGSTDKYSWRDGDWGAGGKFSSWYNQYSLIFDYDFKPKLAAYSILGMLAKKKAETA